MNQEISIPQGPSLTIKPYWGIDNTLVNIKQLIKEYKNSPEVAQFDGLALSQIFDAVKNIPYFEDPAEFEWIQSPKRTLQRGGDCDDKSILLGAIFDRLNVPYRMAVVSTLPSKDLHHIYPEIYLQGVWVPFDATYPYNKMFSESPFTLKRVYDWSGGKTLTYEFTNNNPATLTEQLSSKDIPSLKKIPGVMRIKTLSGPAGISGNVRLAILRGNAKPFYQVSGCGNKCGCNHCKRKRLSRPMKKALLLGYINSINGNYYPLGFDPTAIIGVIQSIFSLFSGSAYQDAYNVWHKAATTPTPNDLNTQATNSAIVAVLGVDYMNPPWGANVCTSSNRCGNRAEWSVIKPEVEAKVSLAAPFFYFLWTVKRNEVPFDMEGLYASYRDFKSNGPLNQQYQQFISTGQNNPPPNYNPNNPSPPPPVKAGMSGMQLLLIAGAAGFFIYTISQKKKGARA